MSEVRRQVAYLGSFCPPAGDPYVSLSSSIEYEDRAPNFDISDRVTPYHGVLPRNMEHEALIGVDHSRPTAELLKSVYIESPDQLDAKWKRIEALAHGRQEALRPTDIIPNFTRERDGKLYEYKFLFAGADSSGNYVYVFRTEDDPQNPGPKGPDDYLVISAYGTEGTITEPIVHSVNVDPETGTHELVLHNPMFNPDLDKIPDYKPGDERPYTSPEGFQKIKLAWREEENSKDEGRSITKATIERHTNNGSTKNRYPLRLPTELSVYKHDQLNPEHRIQIELMADRILAPESEIIRDALARFAHNDMGHPVQAIRNRSAPPPGEGLDNVVAIAVSPEEHLVFSIRTCNDRSDSNVAGHYTVAAVDTHTGESYRPKVSWAWQEEDGRVYLEIQDFDGKSWAYLSWMVGEKGAGYDVTFKRDYRDAGSQLSAIDDLLRMIQRKSGGLNLSEIVEFDRRYGQLAKADELVTQVLNNPRMYLLVDEMMATYIGPGFDDGSALPELKRTRKQADVEIEADFKHAIGTVILNRGILSIRSTRSDMHGNPGDYHVAFGDSELGIVDLAADWIWSNDKRFNIAFNNPYTKEVIKLSCDIRDGKIAPDSWGLEPWGDPLVPFGRLLDKISEKAGRLVPAGTVDKLGSIAVNDTYSLNA